MRLRPSIAVLAGALAGALAPGACVPVDEPPPDPDPAPADPGSCGGYGAYGIPYVSVPGDQPPVPIVFTAYGDESDPGPYPIPLAAPVEGGSDHHVLAVDRDHCRLYELYRAFPTASRWEADSGATWDLRSNALRRAGWTSADAAGLPILPGLVRYDEVAAGEIDHALRVTFAVTRRAYLAPARHWASSVTDPAAPATTAPASPGRPGWSSTRSPATGCSWPTTAPTGSSPAPPTPGGTTTT